MNLLRFRSLSMALAGVAILVSPSLAAAQTPTPADPAESVLAGQTMVEATAEPVATPAPVGSLADTDTKYAPLSSYLNFGDDLASFNNTIALTESTGTWLRRGLWYADVDAMVMQRTWNSDEFTFAQEFDQVLRQVVVQFTVDFTELEQVQVADLGESSPGSEGMPRLALGRFLFRDTQNRDHSAEMVVFGGGEWVDRQGLQASLIGAGEGLINTNRNAKGLQVPGFIDGDDVTNIDESTGRTSFDGAEEMVIEYQSRFHSWEWNYSVAQRMRKDRMELDPNGSWVRRASPGLTYDFLAGLRYFDLEEGVDWSATNIRGLAPNPVLAPPALDPGDGAIADDLRSDGFYRVNASNNLFGGQLGVGMTYETDRWNFSLFTRNGVYVNDGRITADVTYTDLPDDVDDPGFSRDNNENSVAFLSQGGFTARYHLRPNLSLRAGWEYLFVNNVALAPNQLDFNPATDRLDLTGDVFYHGITAGTEYYW
ncbi:MAG: BBP7 family outer membrane beta-barrel protein [Planctomycetota bacterium]